MRFSVLGSFLVDDVERSLVPSARQPRNLLALLTLNANHIVHIADLEQEIWGPIPPRSSQTAIQNYVMNLRKEFSSGLGIAPKEVAKDILITCPRGYLLRLDVGDDLDLHRYQRLAGEGGRALSEGDTETAAGRLRAALDVWRGPALADVDGGPLLTAEAKRLDMAMLATRVQRIEVDLRLGRDHELIGELSIASEQNPLNETIHAQYMTVLHRLGFRLEALKVYERIRRTLVAEVGLEPSARLRQVQHAVLNDTEQTESLSALGVQPQRQPAVC